ncbi:glutathione S-transferase family protein [Scleromatobacter humisilvae]|uniref:Glutathione S-transferase family protein n=1 Tax=Scleromatobacter humisilvae TaxID=2897159 RepID=A0A9X1YG63_9BURK|nr:glutathione S-transferase family protein [Scleromatobacter humisilvae]MCK9685361.1 glutathione S-transferase family protein [Scleromatobacter humisilvae]
MLTFYDYLPSQNAFKVRLLQSQLRIPHDTKYVSIFSGEGQSPEYRRINPTGAVPAIRLEDGRVLAESNAILTFLAEGTDFMPSDPFERAKVNQWLSFEQDYVQNTIGSLRYWTMTSKLDSRPADLVRSKMATAIKALQILDEEFSSKPFICGQHYTVADISLYAYASRADEAGISLAPFKHFERWVQRVERTPGFVAEIYPYSIDPRSSGELA